MKPIFSTTFILFSLFMINEKTKNFSDPYETFSLDQIQNKTIVSEFTWADNQVINVNDQETKKIINKIKSEDKVKTFLQF